MSKKLDTSWFNLKNYDGLKDLDLYGWHQQLAIRGKIKSVLLSYDAIKDIEGKYLSDVEKMEIYEAVEERELLGTYGEWEEVYAAPALRWVERIKNNPIIDLDYENKYESHGSDLKYPFNTHSVTSTPAHIIYLLAADEQLDNVWQYCDILYEDGEVTEKQGELIETPYDLLSIEQESIENIGLAHVTVDLTASDEQIKLDFCHWLSKYREATKFGSKKKYFTNNDLAEWVCKRLLPYIDLMLIAKIEGKRIYNSTMANLIYSDKPLLDFTDKTRRTTQSKAIKLLQNKTLTAIEAQLHSMPQKRSTKKC